MFQAFDSPRYSNGSYLVYPCETRLVQEGIGYFSGLSTLEKDINLRYEVFGSAVFQGCAGRVIIGWGSTLVPCVGACVHSRIFVRFGKTSALGFIVYSLSDVYKC